jgi:hypothetical protein
MLRAVDSASFKEFIKNDFPLLTKDPFAIKHYWASADSAGETGSSVNDNINPLLSKARELIALRKKEYRCSEWPISSVTPICSFFTPFLK